MYANGVLRLWNMLDARCLFKFKAGLSANKESEVDEDDEEEGDGEGAKVEKEEKKEDDETKKMLEQYALLNNRAEQTQWEPTKGRLYAVLFSRVLEIYTVEEEEPVHSMTFDSHQTSIAFIGQS